MTKQELLERRKAFKRMAWRYCICWLVFSHLLILPLGIVLGGLGLFLVTVGLDSAHLLLLRRWGKSRWSKYSLVCPNCSRPLEMTPLHEFLANGNCGQCGGRVLMDVPTY